MLNKKISVVIPAFNVEKYIRICLDSLLSQTFTNWEAFIMDGGSTDATYGIISEYAAKDKRFHAFKEKTSGVTETRNKMLDKITNTDFIVFMDSDDFIHPQTFEAALYVQDKTGADIVEYRYIRAEVDSVPSDYVKPFKLSDISFTLIDDLKPLFFRKGRKGHWGSCWNKLFNFNVVKDIRFNENLSYEDDYFYNTIVISVAKSKAIIQKELYYWRKNPLSLTGNLNYPRYIQCAATRILATWDYFVIGKRIPQDSLKEFKRDMTVDFYRMTVKKTLKHLKDSELRKKLFPFIRRTWFEYIQRKILDPSLLPFIDKLVLSLFLKGKYKAAALISFLHL